MIDAYSGFFATALKNQDFQRWYIDGFAGTGRRIQTKEAGGLFENEPLSSTEVTLEGSARRALSVVPPYHHLVLIDERQKHFVALQALKNEFSGRDIRPVKGDANHVIPALLAGQPWANHRDAGSQRALVFLDPYGINIHFSTLQSLAACQRADVWLLVNLKALVQQLARDHEGLDESKRHAISRFMGCDDWEDRFYEFRELGANLFNIDQGRAGHRKIDRYDAARFYRKRLNDAFSYVSEPLSLRVGHIDDYFQLYCMSNSQSPKAQALIKRGVESILKKFSQASRQR